MPGAYYRGFEMLLRASAPADPWVTNRYQMPASVSRWAPGRPRRYDFPSIIGKKFIGETMSGNHNTSLTRRVWTWLLVLGPLAAGAGIFLGSQKVGNMCGSVFRADNFTAAYYDSLGGVGAEAACNQSIAAAAIPIWILIVLGIILALAAVIIRTVSDDGPIAVTGSSAPWRRRPRRPGPP